MEIPYTALSQDALRGVIMEFVTREGTDYGDRVYSLNEKIEHVMRQLRKGEVIVLLVFWHVHVGFGKHAKQIKPRHGY